MTLQLVGFQNNKDSEPIIQKHLKIKQSSLSLIDSIGIPIQYLDWIITNNYSDIVNICKRRTRNIINSLKKIRTLCFTLFVSKRSLQNKELELIRSSITGTCNIKDITIPLIPILSSDYTWVINLKLEINCLC